MQINNGAAYSALVGNTKVQILKKNIPNEFSFRQEDFDEESRNLQNLTQVETQDYDQLLTFGNSKSRQHPSRVSWEGFSTTSIRERINQRSLPTGVNFTHLQ